MEERGVGWRRVVIRTAKTRAAGCNNHRRLLAVARLPSFNLLLLLLLCSSTSFAAVPEADGQKIVAN